ncbi:MAG: hypothetical protein M3133_05135 [Actinomycetota bacterium]|nr:hypothetical protein [Actinomycetota bacterium]
MTRLEGLLPAGRLLGALDVLLAAWAVFWLAAGLTVAEEVANLKELSATVSAAGAAVEETGRTIGSLEGLPFLGERITEPARRIEEAGRSALQSGRSSGESIDDLSSLLGLAVALIPSIPLLGLYLPLRVSRERERRALRQALRAAGEDPAFLDFLAQRALQNLSYRQLRRLGAAPWQGAGGAQRRALARAELSRLGAQKPSAPTGPPR